MNAEFKYTASGQTDVAALFRRIRREQAKQKAALPSNVKKLERKAS